jgi:serine/threonine-protein kinase
MAQVFFDPASHHVATDAPAGICPHCETQRGEVASRCPEPLCAKKGYHLIRVEGYQKAKAEAQRHRRVIDPFLGLCIDKYVLVAKLGEGGMGAVFVALQRPLMREVALKIISGVEINDVIRTRFEREARAISVLNHPNIVALFDFGVGDGDVQVPFMALEYVKGGVTLRDLWKRLRTTGQQLALESVVHVFKQVLNALSAAHKMGIVHRDIKPENIMTKEVEGDPFFVKLLDFGLVKALQEFQGFEAGLSQAGTIMGTPYYMAPEQILVDPNNPVDARADLYGVGVVMAEAILGEMPFDGDDIRAILGQKINPGFDPLARPSAQHLPAELREFLAKSMARDRSLRFQTAEEMKNAMLAVLNERTLSVFQSEKTAFGQAISAAGSVLSTPSEGRLTATPRPAAPTGYGAPVKTPPPEAGFGASRAASIRSVFGTPAPGSTALSSAPTTTGYRDTSDVLADMQRSRGSGRMVLAIALLIVGLVALGGAFFVPQLLKHDDLDELDTPVATDSAPQAAPATSSAPSAAPPAPAPAAAPPAAATPAAAAAPRPRDVTLSSDPEGAALFVDGRPVGLAPVLFTLSPEVLAAPERTLSVRAVREGYDERVEPLNVGALAREGSARLTLVPVAKPASAPVVAPSAPSPAAVPAVKPAPKPKPKPAPAPAPTPAAPKPGKKDDLEML